MEDTSLLFVDSNNRDTVLYPSGNSYTLHLTTPIRNITKVDLICAKVPNTSFNLQASSNLVINGSSNVVMLPGFYSTSSFCSEFNNSNQTDTKVNYSDAEGIFIFYSSTLSTIQAYDQLANIIGFTSQTAFAASSNPVYTTSTVYSGMNLIKSPRIVNLTTNDYVWLDVEELRTPTSVDAKNIVNVNQTSNNITYSTVTSFVPAISAQTLPLILDVPSQSGQTTIDLPVDLYGASATNGYVCTGAFGAAPLKQVSYGLPTRILAGLSTTCNKYGTFVFAGQNLSKNPSNYSTTTTICSSGDGISWVRGDTISNMYGQSITSSPLTGRFVMVGFSSSVGNYSANTNKAVYSDDGITWYSVTLPFTGFWRCVTCSPVTGRFVAISAGSYSSTEGVYSDDGEHWYQMFLPSSQFWNSVSVNAVGRFVSLVQNSNIGAYSDDGQNWRQITLPLSQSWVSLICSPNGRWVGIAQNTNQGIYSNNGRTWYPMSLPSIDSWFHITCNSSGRFILCPDQSSQGAYSDDGINWNPLNVLLPSCCMTCSPVSGRFVSVWTNGTYSDDGLTWKESFTLPSTISPGDYPFIVYNPISHVYITCNDTNILYSKSYKNWTPTYNIGIFSSWTAAACGTTGRFVMFGFGNVALYSDNGTKWNEITLPTSQIWSSVTCCSHGAYSGRFVAIAGNPLNYNFEDFTDTGVYSDDGVHWTSMTLTSSELWTSVICSQTTGRFFASSIFKGAYSDDGVNWTLIDSLNGVLSSCPTGTYTGRIVCISHNVLTYSDDNGVNWVPCTTTSVDMSPVISVTCSPVSGRFVAVGCNRYGAYSDDGDNWIQMTLDTTMYRNWTSVICNTDGQFIAVSKLYAGVGEQSSLVAVYSDDGINWLPITTTATIAYSQPFAGYTTSTNFTFTPTIDSVTVDNTSSMKVGDSVQGYPDSKVTAISGNTVTFQVATPQSFPFIYIGSTFATYRSSNLSFQTYSSSTSSTSFAMIPMDVPSGYVKIFKENTDYGVSVTYPSRIDKLSRVTVRWLDNYGQPISFNTFDNNSFTLRIHSTRMVPEVERPLTLPAPVPLPKPQKIVAWISIAVLILGLLIITFMKNSIK